MTQLTVAEAHRATKKARSTIERHIEKGTLSATKSASRGYLIDASELQRVYGNFNVDAIKKVKQKDASLQVDATENALEMQQLRHRAELAERERDDAQRREREERQRHDDTKAEKARLFDMLEEAQKTIAALPSVVAETVTPPTPAGDPRPKRGLWGWLTGKA